MQKYDFFPTKFKMKNIFENDEDKEKTCKFAAVFVTDYIFYESIKQTHNVRENQR